MAAETYNLGEAVLGISADLKALQQALNDGEDKAESWVHHMGDFLEHAFGQTVGDFMTRTVDSVIGLLGKVKDGFMSFADMAISGNAQMEGYETKFSVLLGSAAAAQERIAELTKFAATTPFEIPEVVNASAVLQTLTNGALATGDGLRMVGDLASTANVPFSEMSTTVGRLYSAMQAGRPMGEAAARLQELGIMSGDTRNKLEEMQEAGASGAEMWEVFTNATKNTQGMMEKQSQTFEGMMSNFNDFTASAVRTIGAPLFEAAKQGLGKVLEMMQGESVQGLIKNLTGLVQKLADGFIAALPDIENVLERVLNFVSTFTEGMNNGEDFGTIIYKSLRAAFGEDNPVFMFVEDAKRSIDDLKKYVSGIGDAISSGDIGGVFAAIFGADVVKDNPLVNFWKAEVESIQNFVQNLQKHAPTVQHLMDAIGKAGERIGKAFEPVFKRLFGGFQESGFKALDFENVIDGVAVFIETRVVPAIDQFANFMVFNVVPAITAMIDGFEKSKPTIDNVANAIMGVIGFVIQMDNMYRQVRDTIINTVITAFGTMVDFIRGTVVPAVQPLITIINAVGMVFRAVAGVISAVFNLALRVMLQIWEAIRPPIDFVVDIIRNAFKDAMTTVSPIMSQIFGPALKTLQKLFDDMSRSTSGIVNSLMDVVSWLNNIADAINNMPGIPADFVQKSPSRWEKSLNAIAASMRDVDDATPAIMLSGRRPPSLGYAGLAAGGGGGSSIVVRGDLNIDLKGSEADASGIARKVHKKTRTG